jgi:hypothetical protein
MTARRKKAAEPGTARPTATPFIPQLQPSEEDLLELREPYDQPTPEYPDPCWLPRRPDYVIVVAASDWFKEHFPAAAANLTDALRAGKDRHRDPEPDLEAEP